jgi:Cu(I)/Ag(I) efflux system membrane fusion protein
MPEEMLAEIDQTGKIQTTLKIIAPISGILTELEVYLGMNVEKTMTLAVIEGLDPVWILASIPEKDLSLANGRARLSLPAYPGRIFPVMDSKILGNADTLTRSVPIRLSAPNPEGLLIPGLTATLSLRQTGDEGVIIPTQSIIDLGDETRVIVRAQDGSFVPKIVTIGRSSKDETMILEGLMEGEEVVSNGLFLIDSEANFRGAFDRMRKSEETKSPEQSHSEGAH